MVGEGEPEKCRQCPHPHGATEPQQGEEGSTEGTAWGGYQTARRVTRASLRWGRGEARWEVFEPKQWRRVSMWVRKW